MKKILFLSLFSFIGLVAKDLPREINLNRLKATCGTKKNGITLWKSGNLAFNSAPEVAATLAYLKKAYNIKTVVETGTCTGNSTILFSYLFDRVHTIEVTEKNYKVSSNFLKDCENVTCHFGSSDKVLKDLLPSLQDEFVLFYLDAHWQASWPILKEIEEISKTHPDNCIIMIDDIKVPNRSDYPYDRYQEHQCSYEYVAEMVKNVYTDHSIHYILPCKKQSRAKLILLPKEVEELESSKNCE